MTEANGRIDILDVVRDSNYTEPEITSYHEALTGDTYNSPLSRAFFSAENIQIIHNGIRAGVYVLSNNNYIIGNQDINTIKIIMRGVYMKYVRHIPDVRKEIEYLNSIVLDYCIHNVYNEIGGYLKYKKDASTLAVPMNKPETTNSKGENQLEFKKWF